MTESNEKSRSLRCYLSDFKKGQTHCTACHTRLGRVSLMLDGIAIHKDDINNMSQRLNETQWSVLQTTRLRVLCRFCSELYSPPLPCFVDLLDFQRHLLAHSLMNVSSVREYITRLRRIDTLLTEQAVQMPQFNVAQVMAILAEHYSRTSLNNAMSAVNKYAEYVNECLENTPETESQPSSYP
ncbi:flagella biosynthesis regulatory protein FliZ [Providencia rettgeri]|uniref:site-specific integrase n=1 Tax=Providencia rettgeri TaxID=587 RepID=UPI001EE770ED|nr:site-specific integrase [Providencia rettgeri]MCG5372241.1 flagella biosynthesis regulatory protein FliZ [Providencia rettgeri]